MYSAMEYVGPDNNTSQIEKERLPPMKSYNRMISLLLALIMSLSLMATAFAAESGGEVSDYPYDDVTTPDVPENPDDDVIQPGDTEDPVETFVDEDVNPENPDDLWNPAVTDDDSDPHSDSASIPEPDDLALVTSFKDVVNSDWYYKDVTECAKLGIVAGFSDGTFKPDDKVTSVQFLVMLTRTFYNDKVEAVKVPAGSKWYYANTKVAADVGMSKNLAAVDDNPMNRYNMAMALSNTCLNFGKAITVAQGDAAESQIKDWNTIKTSYKTYKNAVRLCYGLGIITGMSDGTFSGANSMTRAQACTVIMRMLKLVNNYNPGDKDNDQYDDGKSQDTGNNSNQTTSKKLANGKDITSANVLEIIAQIQREYPAGTIWGQQGTANNHYYAAGNNSTDVRACVRQWKIPSGQLASTEYACGGFAAMVSDRIFGQSGFPAREVTDSSKVRAGDLILRNC